MADRIFWRETKRGLKLVKRNEHFETTLGSVDIGFGWDAPKDKFGVGISSGISEWTVIAEGLSLEEAKVALIRAMEEGIWITNRWHSPRNPASRPTRFFESKFAELRSRGKVVFQLDKVVGLPGKRKA